MSRPKKRHEITRHDIIDEFTRDVTIATLVPYNLTTTLWHELIFRIDRLINNRLDASLPDGHVCICFHYTLLLPEQYVHT